MAAVTLWRGKTKQNDPAGPFLATVVSWPGTIFSQSSLGGEPCGAVHHHDASKSSACLAGCGQGEKTSVAQGPFLLNHLVRQQQEESFHDDPAPLFTAPTQLPNMASNLSIRLFTLLALFTVGSLAQASIEQTLLAVLRIEGFTKFAELLEGPGGANVIANANNGLLVYAPTNAALQRLESQGIQRRFGLDDMDFSYNAVPRSGGNTKRSSSSHCSSDVAGPGAVDLMTLLNNPAYVNLPPGQNASIVEKNMPKGALPVVHTGLGDVVKVTGLDIPYDHGIIRPVSGLFTLPRLLSETLPFLGADETLAHLDRTGLINDLDNRTGITFLAPDDRSIPSDLPDDVLDNIFRRHTIVGLPVFTSDLNHGDSYQTLAGTTVTVTVQCGDVFIGGARILAGDAIIKNGVVHTVDKVLPPPFATWG